MTQSKTTLLKKDPETMSFWELINYSESLPKTIALLDDDDKEAAKADLAAIANQCSLKWDELYVTLDNKETMISKLKKDKIDVDLALKSHINDRDDLKVMIRQIRRSLPPQSECDYFSGKYFQFKVKAITPGQRYALTFKRTKDISEFTLEDQEKFFYKEEKIETKEIVITSISGKEVSRTTEPKSTTQFILNEDAIINAYQDGSLPHGIKVIQNYRITTKRICGKMDVETSSYTRQFLRQSSSSD
tara:strand:+ start:166 stop:903 length:738 start_codon:yes stop_codon:yes gene_type:complete